MLANAVYFVVLSRVLPIAQFGVYSYAASLSALGMTLVTAGLNALAVRYLVSQSSHAAMIMTSLLVIREVFAVISYGILLTISLTSGEAEVVLGVAIAALVLFVRALDVPDFWYQARMKSKRTAILRTVLVVAWLIVKVVVALLVADLLLFLVLFVVEPLLTSIALLIMYLRDAQSDRFGRLSMRLSFDLVRQGSPLTLSAAADQINARADVVIIQAMLSSVDVAIYSAGVKISEMLYFGPNAFMGGVFPAMLAARTSTDNSAYPRIIQRYMDRFCWLGMVVGAVVLSASGVIVIVLFGNDYSRAVPVLMILAALTPFVFMQSVASKWIVAEDLLWASLWRHGVGAVANVVLNLIWIPLWGITAAALASCASYILSTYLVFFTSRKTRPIAVHMSIALLWPFRVLVIRVRGVLRR